MAGLGSSENETRHRLMNTKQQIELEQELQNAFTDLENLNIADDPDTIANPKVSNSEDVKDLKDEIQRLNLEYGDQVLANIKLNQAKRHSLQLAEQWQQEAENLKEQLRLVQSEDERNNVSMDDGNSNNGTYQRGYIDDSDDERDEFDPNDDANIKDIYNIPDSDDDHMDPSAKNMKLKSQIKNLGFELGDEILRNAKLNSEKRESMQLVEKWKKEAQELRKLLTDKNMSTSESKDHIEKERRSSVVAIESFQNQISNLRNMLGDQANTVTPTDVDQLVSTNGPSLLLDTSSNNMAQSMVITPGLRTEEFLELGIGIVDSDEENILIMTEDNKVTLGYKPRNDRARKSDPNIELSEVTPRNGDDEDYMERYRGSVSEEDKAKLWEEVKKLESELGDEIMANVKLKNEKRESIALQNKWMAEAQKLKNLLDQGELELSSILSDESLHDLEVRTRTPFDNEMRIHDLKKDILSLKEENDLLQKSIDMLHVENDKLKRDKLTMIQSTNQALNQSREIIKILSQQIVQAKQHPTNAKT